MTISAPTLHTAVTLSSEDGTTLSARIEVIEGGQLTVGVPTGNRPAVGTPVMLHWPAGPRGRYALAGTIVRVVPAAGAGPTHLVVDAPGEPRLEQQRRFVRGGGGEPVTLHPAGDAAIVGSLYDIAEQGLRARCSELPGGPGTPVTAQVDLHGQPVEVDGAILNIGLAATGEYDVVIEFVADESLAQTIRRYVLRQQMLARARTADG
jgi:hypothetical protein